MIGILHLKIGEVEKNIIMADVGEVISMELETILLI
jgi:hypothetical protein